MFLDLDGFKWINDSLGHDVGDQLLIDVAHRLQGCVRNQDTVARLGGDEFTVVVNDLHEQRDLEDLRTISEKLVAVLREPFQLRNAPHYISGSVGTAWICASPPKASNRSSNGISCVTWGAISCRAT